MPRHYNVAPVACEGVEEGAGDELDCGAGGVAGATLGVDAIAGETAAVGVEVAAVTVGSVDGSLGAGLASGVPVSGIGCEAMSAVPAP